MKSPTCSIDWKRSLFSEHNDVSFNGEPNDSFSPAIPADAVDGFDEFAKRQYLLFVIGFHDLLPLGFPRHLIGGFHIHVGFASAGPTLESNDFVQ